MQNREYSRSTTVCVTGAAGYIGSWLVRSLLRRGYHVHATVRDAGKASWLQSSLGGIGHLQIFEADRNKKGSFDEAVKDCEFVLHVAASTVFNISAKENIGVYAIKLLAEKKAFVFAKENGIDLVSIIPSIVAGPFLTPAVAGSVQTLLSPITGDSRHHPVLLSVCSTFGSIPLVHIEDVCDAHVFLMEQSGAEGRYLCSACSCRMHELTDLLAVNYPTFTSKSDRYNEGYDDPKNPVISSKRLTDLGFEFKYGAEDIIHQSVACCVDCGFLMK